MLYLLCYHEFCNIKTAGLHRGKVWPAIHHRYGKTISDNNAMITILVRDCKHISQSFYDSVINRIQFHQITCTCGHRACLTIHGYYQRSIKLPRGTIRLRICRVRCSACGKTHALLLSSIVPYSQIRTFDQQQICITYEQQLSPVSVCDSNPQIDENNIKAVLRNYRHRWREMLFSLRISLSSTLMLVHSCFANYSLQFMQIHRGPNRLFLHTT